MAGDWIKMRMDLQTHPKVVRILSATKSDKFRAIGGLHAVWSVFDTHSEDGQLFGYTPDTLDHIIGWPGFAQAMIDVGWLQFSESQALVLPEFSEHNGASAKRRAEDAKRKKREREEEKLAELSGECPQNVRKMSAKKTDDKQTREEKSREEEESTTTSSSDDDVRQCPIGSLVNLYHECMPNNPQVRVLNDSRKGAIRQRWKEAATMDCKPFGYKTRAEGLAAWRLFFEVCAESDFLTGRSPAQPGKPPFVADIDFLFSPAGFAKTLENKYHREAA